MKTIEKVIQYVEEAKKTIPNATAEKLREDGAIFYMNGFDGTEFDWQVNGHVCEFVVFWKDSRVGYVVARVNANDEVSGWVSEDDSSEPFKELEPMKLEKGEAKNLAALMYALTDAKELWNKNIAELDFSSVT